MEWTVKECPRCDSQELDIAIISEPDGVVVISSNAITEVKRVKVTCKACGETFTVQYYVKQSLLSNVVFKK